MDLLEDVSVKIRYPPMLETLGNDISVETAQMIRDDTGDLIEEKQ